MVASETGQDRKKKPVEGSTQDAWSSAFGRVDSVCYPKSNAPRERINRSQAAEDRQDRVHENVHCTLLENIPFEIRRDMIFNLFLSTDAALHLVRLDGRVGHVKCFEKSRHSKSSSCHCVLSNQSLNRNRAAEDILKTSHIELALLKTCRQAYREGIHLLYARLVFEVDHPKTLNWFARTVHPQRLATIARLNISLRLEDTASTETPVSN